MAQQSKSLGAVLDETARKPGDVLGDRLRHHRDRRRWTQRDLCSVIEERFGAVIDPATMARIETGQRRVTVDEACLLAVALDVPLVALLWPLGESEPVSVAPGIEVEPWVALKWSIGREPLDGGRSPAWDEATRPIDDWQRAEIKRMAEREAQEVVKGLDVLVNRMESLLEVLERGDG